MGDGAAQGHGFDDRRLWLRPGSRAWLGAPVQDCRPFHAALPGYHPTPLRAVDEFAGLLRVAAVLVKDESRRFDLPAFKILGASWGVYRALCERLGRPPRDGATLEQIRNDLAPLRDVCLLTATAGNHGHAVARMARWLGFRCVIVLPAATGVHVASSIRNEGAEVHPVDGTYDQAVDFATKMAEHDKNYVMVQDTAFPGYERVPEWIVQGYDTLFHEIDDQLGQLGRTAGIVFVPTGVGSLLAAAIRHYHAPGRSTPPAVVSVELAGAACVLASMQADRPIAIHVQGVASQAAGLNAGTMSSTAWPTIRDGLDAAVAIEERRALDAQVALHSTGIHAGACGSASLAGAIAVLAGESGAEPRHRLNITAATTVVLISTDGCSSEARQSRVVNRSSLNVEPVPKSLGAPWTLSSKT